MSDRKFYITFDGVNTKVIETDKVPTLEVLQKCVGGLIESLFTDQLGNIEVTGYVNEEGLLLQLPINTFWYNWNGQADGIIFAGNLVITGLDPNTGNTLLLTKDEVTTILAYQEVYNFVAA
jgi:Domain of unknown function (DUF3846)